MAAGGATGLTPVSVSEAFYPGEMLFIAGSAFTLWSYSLLGHYVSPYAQVLPGHKVVERGPYRYIRHPGYLGQIVAFIGLGLALQSWLP
jgi:protein-S-isoprenylcysteine O-methyltransferase Ste14